MSASPPLTSSPRSGRTCSSCGRPITPEESHVFLFARGGSGITQRRVNATYKVVQTEFHGFFRPRFFLCTPCTRACGLGNRWFGNDLAEGRRARLLAALQRHTGTTASFGWWELEFPYYKELMKRRQFSRMAELVSDALADTSMNGEYATVTLNWSGAPKYWSGDYLKVVIDGAIDAIGVYTGFKYERRIAAGVHSFQNLRSFLLMPDRHYSLDLRFHRGTGWSAKSFLDVVCYEFGAPPGEEKVAQPSLPVPPCMPDGSEAKFCARCGAALEKEARFCAKCGVPVGGVALR